MALLWVLATGSRYWEDEAMVRTTLAGLKAARGGRPFHLVHGAAKGLDTLAGDVATDLNGRKYVHPVPAKWNTHDRSKDAAVRCHCPPGDVCKAAGVRRNERMLDRYPKIKLCLAFHQHLDFAQGSGTYDMVCRAAGRGIQTYVVTTWEVPF